MYHIDARHTFNIKYQCCIDQLKIINHICPQIGTSAREQVSLFDVSYTPHFTKEIIFLGENDNTNYQHIYTPKF